MERCKVRKKEGWGGSFVYIVLPRHFEEGLRAYLIMRDCLLSFDGLLLVSSCHKVSRLGVFSVQDPKLPSRHPLRLQAVSAYPLLRAVRHETTVTKESVFQWTKRHSSTFTASCSRYTTSFSSFSSLSLPDTSFTSN